MSSTVPRHPGPLHRPDPEGEVEAWDAAGCHPEGVAGTTTMEARLGVTAAAAVAVEGAVVAVAVAVAVGVDVGVAPPPPLDERA